MEHVIYDFHTAEKTVVPFTADEITEQQRFDNEELPLMQFEDLRVERNQLLTETDYLGLPDLGGFSAEMTAYRQALRDLPANTTDPANPIWPTKP